MDASNPHLPEQDCHFLVYRHLCTPTVDVIDATYRQHPWSLGYSTCNALVVRWGRECMHGFCCGCSACGLAAMQAPSCAGTQVTYVTHAGEGIMHCRWLGVQVTDSLHTERQCRRGNYSESYVSTLSSSSPRQELSRHDWPCKAHASGDVTERLQQGCGLRRSSLVCVLLTVGVWPAPHGNTAMSQR